MQKKTVILGSGGFAREAYCHMKDAGIDGRFFDQHSGRRSVTIGNQEHEVITDAQSLRGEQFIACIGDPKARQSAVQEALMLGLIPAPTFIHPTAVVYDVELGLGGIITPFCVITTHVKIGNYALINWHTSIGHDTTLGDFVTTFPGSKVSGNVTIGDLVLLGAGAFIRQGQKVGSNITIGAQAAVVKDLHLPGTYIGVPARIKEERVS